MLVGEPHILGRNRSEMRAEKGSHRPNHSWPDAGFGKGPSPRRMTLCSAGTHSLTDGRNVTLETHEATAARSWVVSAAMIRTFCRDLVSD